MVRQLVAVDVLTQALLCPAVLAGAGILDLDEHASADGQQHLLPGVEQREDRRGDAAGPIRSQLCSDDRPGTGAESARDRDRAAGMMPTLGVPAAVRAVRRIV
jgi:hypothetical protein